jgi:hypothetical protein
MKKINKKGAMEMSVGTIVTIVLLMSMLVLGLVLIQSIFRGATQSVNTINTQVQSEIDNLFNDGSQELVVSLGTEQTADVKQGTRNFGFVIGLSPDDPTYLMRGECTYDIDVSNTGTYCSKLQGYTTAEIKKWITSGTSNVKFSKREKGIGYDLITLNIPDSIPVCTQRFTIDVECPDDYTAGTWFNINVIKKGIL